MFTAYQLQITQALFSLKEYKLILWHWKKDMLASPNTQYLQLKIYNNEKEALSLNV